MYYILMFIGFVTSVAGFSSPAWVSEIGPWWLSIIFMFVGLVAFIMVMPAFFYVMIISFIEPFYLYPQYTFSMLLAGAFALYSFVLK